MLQLQHFSKKVSGKKILDNVTLMVPHGTIAIVLGPSGVGKSTLLRALNNLETLDTGTATLDGKTLDITKVNKTHIIGMVFQQFALFENLTVLSNIVLPLKLSKKKTESQAKKIAYELLRNYQLEEYADRYPKHLSGGQKQRVAIVRTLALSPQVICLDEPTSALDPLLTAYVAHTINDVAHQGYIVLVATHDISLVEKLFGTMHLMKAGKIVESATKEELQQTPQHYTQLMNFMYGSQ